MALELEEADEEVTWFMEVIKETTCHAKEAVRAPVMRVLLGSKGRFAAVSGTLTQKANSYPLSPGSVIDAHPELFGVGIEESATNVVRCDRLELIGATTVAINDKNYKPGADGKRYCFLSLGDRFDLTGRRKTAAC